MCSSLVWMTFNDGINDVFNSMKSELKFLEQVCFLLMADTLIVLLLPLDLNIKRKSTLD